MANITAGVVPLSVAINICNMNITVPTTVITYYVAVLILFTNNTRAYVRRSVVPGASRKYRPPVQSFFTYYIMGLTSNKEV